MVATNNRIRASRDPSQIQKARRERAVGLYGLSLIGFVVLMATDCNSFAVETDSFRLHALQHYSIERSWDNVEGPPLWVGGVSPKKRWANSLHTVFLGPGQEITIRVPTRSMVRVLGIHQLLTPQEVELWVSDGSGLYGKRTSAISEDHRSLFLVPDNVRPCLARVRRPAGAHSGIEVALFTSRLQLPQDVVPYQEYQVSLEPQFKVRRASEFESQNYFCLHAEQTREISIDGPARIAVVTRLRYPRHERRSFQAYRLNTKLNGNRFQTLEYQTGAETRTVLVDEHSEVLGRREVAHLDFPGGRHRLELDATADVYARLLVYDRAAYLLKRNQPAWLEAEHRILHDLEGESLSSWDITPQAADLLPQLGGEFIPSQEQLAYRSSRDNRHPEGGLRSMMLMRTAAAYRPDEPTVRHVAEQIRGFHTFFRNLLPSEHEDGRQQFAWFSARRLREEYETAEPRAIAEQHIDNLVDRLSNGFFTALGDDPTAANRYRLPADLGATLLRVVVDRRDVDAPLQMLLQYDQRSPIELEVAQPEHESDASTAEIALAALKWRHGGYDHGTLGGPFSQHNVPAQFLSVATAELRVPRGIREIRVWTPVGTDQHIGVALQYRTSKSYQLSESEFLAMERRSDRDVAESFRAFVHDEATGRNTTSHDDSYANRELTNHWLPLVRLLRSQRRSFEAYVVPPRTDDTLAVGAAELDVDSVVESGRKFAAHQDWLPCLEAWSDVVPHSSGGLRREGLITRTVALRQLGEAFLADRTLRGLYLFDKDPAVRAAAFEQLRQIRRRSESTDSLEQLLAAAATGIAENDALNELIDVLLENGDDQLALTLSLVTPARNRSRENVLRAAYRLQWWEVFERELESCPAAQRSFWIAMRMQSEGDYTQAFQHFQRSGTEGREYAVHFAAAQDIHAQLQSDSVDDRVRAIFDWEQWQATHPGPRVWQDAGAMVQSHAGTESLHSIDRNLYAQFYKANRKRPLVMRVQGPQNLRFECRPIHSIDAQSPRDDWIHVYTVGGHRPVAVNGNRPSSGLQIVGDPVHVPGRQVLASLALGPGLHEVKVAADALPLLVRVYAQRPALPICILPTLTPETLIAAADHGLDVTSPDSSGGAKFSLIPSGSAYSINNLPLIHQCCPPWRENRQRQILSDTLLAARFALRTSEALDEHAATLKHWARHACEDSAEERTLALARLGNATNSNQGDQALLEQLPQATAEAFLTARQQYTAIIAQPISDDAAARRRMTLLLWLAESNRDIRAECRVRGQQLLRDHPTVDGLAAMHYRLTREGSWSRVTQLTSSAGVRKLEWPRWLPESPSLRVRQSLIASLEGTERLLFGREATVLSMRNFEPVQLDLTLSPAAVGHLPTKPLRVVCQVGESSPQWTSVEREGPEQDLKLEIPAGLQHLRLWVDEPTANHYVRLDVREVASADPLCTRPPVAAEFHTTGRVYDVATHDEPVRMFIEGPAWLRVDELRGETTHTRYVSILDRQRRIELAPDNDNEEALFRVFLYVPRPGAQIPQTHWVKIETEPLPPPLIQEPLWDESQRAQPESPTLDSSTSFYPWHNQLEILALRAPDSPVISMDVYDYYSLGGQEDGTWSASLGGFTRRPLEEGLNGRQPGRFLETRVTHRHYDIWADTHRRTDLLLRPRDKSGPTFGVLHRMRRSGDCWPVVFELNASAYAQDNDIEWSAAVRGRLRYRRDLTQDLHHTASMSVFGRLLSQDESKYLSGRADQDIFTTYKANHRGGLTFSDTWVYQPWIDTRWWIRPSLITNEDFNPIKPDQLNLRCGWAQAFGLAEVEASYRLTWFLEDANRPKPRLQNLLYLDVITDLPPLHRRSELAFRVQHDLDRGSTSAQISVTWFFDKGRLDHDRWPGERSFPTIRQQREVALLGQATRF
jgi:hypothetical protein